LAHVLIVEDHYDCAMLVRYLLELDGHTASVTTDGSVAIAALQAGTFDLVVTDLHLPKMGGLALVRALRAEPATRDVPVIALSGDWSHGDREAMMGLGVSAILDKPFMVDALSEAIEAALTSQAGIRHLQADIVPDS
jgi:CheY-like chemotaxis protein